MSILIAAGFALVVLGAVAVVASVVLTALQWEMAWIVTAAGWGGVAAGCLVLFVKVLIDRLRNEEDDHYSRNVHD